jgi:hypothetical protein
MTRAQQLAQALMAIARVNHYMVGLVEPVSWDEVHDAMQILIRHENKHPNATVRRALDLAEMLEEKARIRGDNVRD